MQIENLKLRVQNLSLELEKVLREKEELAQIGEKDNEKNK
jgi:hypothetical protein